MPEHVESVDSVLSFIELYASEHSLTGAQIREIFSEGVIVCFRNGTVKIRTYSPQQIAEIRRKSGELQTR
jgi:hypothetical protein